MHYLKPIGFLVLLLVGITSNRPTCSQQRGPKPLFDLRAMLDESTLKVNVLQDWHQVNGPVPMRQKLISIEVGQLVPGRPYRVPVRMIVPATGKAKGFHLTGGHNLQTIQRDARPRGVDLDLLRGGVGLVQTIVQVLQQSDQGELGRRAERKFIETLNPHHSVQYWGWPATLMRATTAAYAEKEHFSQGKVALSGGSKNGASPSVALIHDKRMTAVHASVSPIWDSPLRLCNEAAWQSVRSHNQQYVAQLRKKNPGINAHRLLNHAFLGGTYGPVYNKQALAAGHQWKDLKKLAEQMADNVFISRNLKRLHERGVDLLFHPGTHDFVNFDIAWGGEHHPRIPIYLGANSGHGQQRGHPQAERGQQNKTAFLLHHFFDGVPSLLDPPAVKTEINRGRLKVTATFKPGSRAETGRIWWIYDRGPDGSAAYLGELIPDEHWHEMKDADSGDVWSVEIQLKPGASRIDFFSNHRKTIRYQGRALPTYLSSPYTRVDLGNR
ncbi:MAG: hypothetical protein VX776_01125 [Planctomycetota bacterium]|nr:hypothetical protein [Planctomycetota bacterium]MEC9095198.1 hypothetical protein [Planctomycetota bacterium]